MAGQERHDHLDQRVRVGERDVVPGACDRRLVGTRKPRADQLADALEQGTVVPR
jgi:hypothetical protein